MPIIQQKTRIRTPKIPRWPYTINQDSWQAQGLEVWVPLTGNIGYGYDFSGNNRHLNNVSGVSWVSDPDHGHVADFAGSGGMEVIGQHVFLPPPPQNYNDLGSPGCHQRRNSHLRHR